MNKKLAELEQLKADYESKLKTAGREILKEVFEEFFDKFPDIYGVHWTQYTPYFNDGEACEFRVNSEFGIVVPRDMGEAMLKIKHKSKYSDHEYAAFGECSSNKNYMWLEGGGAGPLLTALAAIPKNDDIYLALFGNHCRVTATRAGFEVTAYEHD